MFGRMASSNGVGHNLEVTLAMSEEQKSESSRVLVDLKEEWDHSSWLDLLPHQSSSLEVLTWQMVQRWSKKISSLEVKESSRIRCGWQSENAKDLILVYRRPLSVLWQDKGGGARLNFEFFFQDSFKGFQHVLVPRSILENELESLLKNQELSDLKISSNVKENEAFMDALFNKVQEILPSLKSIGCELENEKKWLIHSPNLTR